jgi:hypothetical protein
MPRERDANRKLFHRGHWEVISARFREQMSHHTDSEGDTLDNVVAISAANALTDLAMALAARFGFDNEDFDREIFLERCGM